MKSLTDILLELTNEELKEVYFENKQWGETGDLKNENSVIRRVHKEYCDENNIGYSDYYIKGMVESLLMEIASRLYEPKIEDGIEEIDTLGLNTHITNALKRAKIRTIFQLKNLSDYQLSQIKTVGEGRLKEIKDALRKHETSKLD